MKIKRTSSFVKGSALQQANLAAAIDQSEVQVGSCGHPLTGRPLWMVGKYDICFDCYEERQREIEKSLPVEASVNVKQFRGLVHERNELLKALQSALKELEWLDRNALIKSRAGGDYIEVESIQEVRAAISNSTKSLPEDAQYDPMDEPEDGAESGWEEALSD